MGSERIFPGVFLLIFGALLVVGFYLSFSENEQSQTLFSQFLWPGLILLVLLFGIIVVSLYLRWTKTRGKEAVTKRS